MFTTGKHVELLEKHLPGDIKHPIKHAVLLYRSITRSIRVLPDFIIIGARKCGTSSLYHYLTHHPSILPAFRKEVFYFTTHFAKGVGWYRKHFPTRFEMVLRTRLHGRQALTGEATPSYIFDSLVAERIRRMAPGIKLIVLLRNPVDTAYSAYYHGIKQGVYTTENNDFAESVAGEIARLPQLLESCASEDYFSTVRAACPLLASGMYVELLKPWFSRFPKEQIRVVISETLFCEPRKVYHEVLNFLGLPAHEMNAYEKRNGNEYPEMDPELRERMENFFAPHNERLKNFLGVDPGWDLIAEDQTDALSVGQAEEPTSSLFAGTRQSFSE